MRIMTTIICLFIFSTSVLAEGFKLNTSKTKSFQLHTSLKNAYSLETLPKTLDKSNKRQEQSRIIPRNILASVLSTTKNVSMEFGSPFSLGTSQINYMRRQAVCSQAGCPRQNTSSRQVAYSRQAAYSSQNTNVVLFPRLRALIQNLNNRMASNY